MNVFKHKRTAIISIALGAVAILAEAAVLFGDFAVQTEAKDYILPVGGILCGIYLIYRGIEVLRGNGQN